MGDPDVAADVLVHRAPLFVKEGTAFFPGSSLAGEGLLVSDGDVWARQRRLTNPAFRRAAVDTYASSMANAGVSLLSNEWKTRSVRDVYEDFNTLTLRAVADALFGADVRGARAMEINAAIKEAFEFFGNRSSTGFIVPEWVPIPDNGGTTPPSRDSTPPCTVSSPRDAPREANRRATRRATTDRPRPWM